MMNLSGEEISDTCAGKFLDLPSSDWGCKYAEAALAKWFIAANTYFRPNDSVTEVEALKMIMNAKNMYVYELSRSEWSGAWYEKYISDAKSHTLIRERDEIYLTPIHREKVFYIATRSFFDSWVTEQVIHWEYLWSYYDWWDIIKIDATQYPFIHTQEYLSISDFWFDERMPLILPDTQVKFQITRQWRQPYDTEGMWMYSWETEIKLIEWKLEIWERVFDACGNSDTYKNYSWYNSLWDRDDIVELCYAWEIWLAVYAEDDNTLWRHWPNTDHTSSVSVPYQLNFPSEAFEEYDFSEFWKRVGEILPIKMKHKITGEIISIDYNFVEDEVVEK